MAEQYLINDTTLTSIADAIRSKYNDATKYLPKEMPPAIRGIPVGSVGLDNLICHSVSGVLNDFSGGILTVQYYALAYNSKLTMASFASATTFGEAAFSGCTSLESVYAMVESSVCAQFASNAFTDTPIMDSSYLGHYGSIYVRASLLSNYMERSQHSAFSSRFVGV